MAVNECIRENILADVLRKNRAEVIDLFMTTYDADLHKKAIEEEARETGMAEGRAEGRAFTIRAMLLDHQSSELIKKYTGASDEEIKQVKEQLAE